METTPTRSEIDLYKPTLHNKSDNELQAVIITNYQKINALPNTASPSQLAQGHLWLAEIMACNEILEARKKQKQAQENAAQTWKSMLVQRQENAIYNLPAAASANGQLVAAIVEDEDGKTAEEIGSWCEELAALSPEERKELLDKLVSERILEQDENQKYHLLNICTESLFPANIPAWAEKQFQRDPKLNTSTAKLVIAVIGLWEEAFLLDDLTIRIKGLSSRDLELLKESYPFLSGVSNVEAALRHTSVSKAVSALCKGGMLKSTYVNSFAFYYFPMLGEN
jgi:hypothetical protein